MKYLISFIAFIFTACVMDSINISQMVNETDEEIKVQVIYNKALLDSQMVSSYQNFIETNSERGRSFVVTTNIDSLSITYLVPPNATLNFQKGNGSEPDFSMIKYINIQSVGQNHKYSQPEILGKLKSKGKGFWEWRLSRIQGFDNQ
jgi:hypothetical protein